MNAGQLTVICQALCEHHDTVYILDANNQPVQSTPELLVPSLILLQIIIAICTCLRNNFWRLCLYMYFIKMSHELCHGSLNSLAERFSLRRKTVFRTVEYWLSGL